MRRATGSERPTNGRRHALIVLLVLVCALSLSFSACSSNDTEQTTDSTETSEAVAPEPVVEEGRLSLLVTADGWETSDGTVTVNVTGTPEDGDEVTATITIVPGMDLELNYGPGTYAFATDAITKGETVYEAVEASVNFDGSDDQTVTLNIPKDAAATEALAQQKAEEERARAEAEAAAQAEAEAQAQAETEAQAQAEAERQKAQETTTSQTNERTVYITKTGEKYHESWCSSLRKSKIPISLSEAEALGYEPCKNCH